MEDVLRIARSATSRDDIRKISREARRLGLDDECGLPHPVGFTSISSRVFRPRSALGPAMLFTDVRFELGSDGAVWATWGWRDTRVPLCTAPEFGRRLSSGEYHAMADDRVPPRSLVMGAKDLHSIHRAVAQTHPLSKQAEGPFTFWADMVSGEVRYPTSNGLVVNYTLRNKSWRRLDWQPAFPPPLGDRA